jgi:hypothetical protein
VKKLLNEWRQYLKESDFPSRDMTPEEKAKVVPEIVYTGAIVKAWLSQNNWEVTPDAVKHKKTGEGTQFRFSAELWRDHPQLQGRSPTAKVILSISERGDTRAIATKWLKVVSQDMDGKAERMFLTPEGGLKQ